MMLSDKAKSFLAKGPTLIGTLAGVRYYEHPTRGDEAPLIAIGHDGRVRKTGFWEMPSLSDI